MFYHVSFFIDKLSVIRYNISIVRSAQRLAYRILVTQLPGYPVCQLKYRLQDARYKIKNLFLVISFSFYLKLKTKNRKPITCIFLVFLTSQLGNQLTKLIGQLANRSIDFNQVTN